MEAQDLCDSLRARKSNSSTEMEAEPLDLFTIMDEDEDMCSAPISISDDVDEEVTEEKHKRILKPTWNVDEFLMRRITEHNISDCRTTEIFEQSVKDASYESLGWTREDVIKSQEEIGQFMRVWLDNTKSDEDLDEMQFYEKNLPKSYSAFSVFPVHYMATVGAAGTGKSESVKSYQSHCMDMFTTSYTNSASEEYTKGLVAVNHPQCRDYERHCKTLIKALSIPFTAVDVRRIIDKIGKNTVGEMGADLYCMEDAFIQNCRGWTREEMQEESRKLMIANLKALRELAMICYDQVKKNFTHRKHYKFRNGSLSPDSPFYQSAKATFEWINQFDECEQEISKLKKRSQLKNYITNRERKICAGLAHETNVIGGTSLRIGARREIKTQDQYKRYCSMFSDSRTQPHILSQQNIAMIEEDGKTPVFLLRFHSIMTTIINMMYNPPHHHIGPSVWFSSGSDAQIGAVGAISALSHVISSDFNTTVRGEFYRRNQTSITSAVSEVSRILPIVLENNMEVTKETIETLAFNEKHPRQIGDAAHCPDGKRFYFTHADNNRYITGMENSKKANTPVYELLSVSNNIIQVGGELKNAVEKEDFNPDGVSLVGLSTLTPEKARYNRQKAWKDKLATEYCLSIGSSDSRRPLLEVADPNIVMFGRRPGVVPPNQKNQMEYSSEMEAVLKQAKFNMFTERSNLIKRDKLENSEKMKDVTYSEATTMSGSLIEDMVNKKEIYVTKELEEDEECEAWGGNKVDDEEAAGKKRIPKRTKVFITMRACEGLSAVQHQHMRRNAESISDFLGNGAVYADKCHTNARKADQLGDFTYDPVADTIVIYSGIDFPAHLEAAQGEDKKPKYNLGGLIGSAMENEQSCQMFMTFKRKRMFAKGKEICALGAHSKITPRGVNGTINDIMKDQAFNVSGASTGFKVMVFGGLIHEFLLHKAMQHLQEDAMNTEAQMNLIGRMADMDFKQDSHLTEIARDYIEFVETIKKVYTQPMSTKAKEIKEAKRIRLVIMSKYLDKLRALITIIIRKDQVRAKENIVTFYLHESPLYSLRHKFKACNTVKLSLYGDVPLTFLGNGEHPALKVVIDEAKDASLSLESKTFQDYGEEVYKNRYGMKKSYCEITGWGLKQWFPEVWYSSSLTMKVGNVLVATSDPSPPQTEINWHDIFGDEKLGQAVEEWKRKDQKRKFGLMTKLHMPMLYEGDKFIYNQSFTLPRGEFLNFPQKWRPGGGEEGSEVIVKTSDGSFCKEVMYYDSARSVMPEDKRSSDFKDAVFDNSHVHAFPVPYIMDLAMTSHAAQGRTIRGKVFMDFETMVKKNGNGEIDRFVFEKEETTRAAALVCSTRADNPRNLHTANSLKIQHMLIKPVSASTEKMRKKMKAMFKTEYVR
uniref:ORF77 n=1 Tax=Malaco herpesvirus 1 TaxID=3031797 RepID=A0AA48SF29_9VIRU|nr:TPA_asm: ORF77 [Malaco herpesvirus 1]